MSYLFFTCETPQAESEIAQGIDQLQLFGSLSDSLPIVAGLLALGVVIFFFSLGHNVASYWSILANVVIRIQFDLNQYAKSFCER